MKTRLISPEERYWGLTHERDCSLLTADVWLLYLSLLFHFIAVFHSPYARSMMSSDITAYLAVRAQRSQAVPARER